MGALKNDSSLLFLKNFRSWWFCCHHWSLSDLGPRKIELKKLTIKSSFLIDRDKVNMFNGMSLLHGSVSIQLMFRICHAPALKFEWPWPSQKIILLSSSVTRNRKRHLFTYDTNVWSKLCYKCTSLLWWKWSPKWAEARVKLSQPPSTFLMGRDLVRMFNGISLLHGSVSIQLAFHNCHTSPLKCEWHWPSQKIIEAQKKQ